jgi:hypothetical protein
MAYDYSKDSETVEKVARVGVRLADGLQDLFFAHPELFSQQGTLRTEIARLRGDMNSISNMVAGEHVTKD